MNNTIDWGGGSQGVYTPQNSGDTPSHTLPPFEGDSCSVNLYIFPINLGIDNIPKNPLKVWDHLL